jgi:hypothetical protein
MPRRGRLVCKSRHPGVGDEKKRAVLKPACAGGIALLAWCLASSVQAHAPLARELVLAGEDGGLFVRMPGFGWLVRDGEQREFAYACDALWGVQPGESATPMVRRADGSMLVGTAAGLRAIDARGCPLAAVAGELGTAPISALAIDASRSVAYAVVTGAGAALHRSEDGGASWARRAELPSDEPVTALQVSADSERVYVSVGSSDARAALLVSSDGGSSLLSIAQTRALVLLDVAQTASGDGVQLWAMARAPSGQRGADILRAEQPEGPWAERLRVNFFGGFAREPSGVVWIGDEGGGVFRSDDGGDHFSEVAPEQAVACLAHGAAGLWACTPGTSQKRAVAVARDPAAGFADVVAFAAVDRMVECGDELDVSAICAAAWSEWQVDVRMAASASPPSAPAASDGGSDAGLLDGDAEAAGADAGASSGGASCALASPGVARRGGSWPWSALLAAIALLTRRRRSAGVDRAVSRALMRTR